MSKESFFKKIKLHRNYVPALIAVIACICMIGGFTAANSELWLDEGKPNPILTAERSGVDAERSLPELPDEEDFAAIEGILDRSEPVIEPWDEDNTVIGNEANTSAEDEKQLNEQTPEDIDTEARSVSLFSKKLLPPADGEWTAEFGFCYDETHDDYRLHNGRDMSLELGTIVYACEGGKVITAEENNLWGGVVAIEGKDLTLYYYGIIPSSIAVGDDVAAGEIIGTVAAPYDKELDKGCHLHLVIMKKDECLDPAKYFEK